MFSAARFEKTFAYLDLFWEGVVCTVSLSALTVVFGFVLALILAMARLSDLNVYRCLSTASKRKLQKQGGVMLALSRFNPVKLLASAYVEIFRATPLLVQLFIIYYVIFNDIEILPGFKLFGFIRFERFFPGVVALALNSGAYLSEIIRSGIQSIDGGQTEASRSLGLGRVQTLRYIVLPQAIKNILPAIANEFVTIIKESSITYTIGVQEIMSAVAAVKGATFAIAEPLIVATVLYFCLTFPTSKIIEHFEKKMSVGDNRAAVEKAKAVQKRGSRWRKKDTKI